MQQPSVQDNIVLKTVLTICVLHHYLSHKEITLCVAPISMIPVLYIPREMQPCTTDLISHYVMPIDNLQVAHVSRAELGTSVVHVKTTIRNQIAHHALTIMTSQPTVQHALETMMSPLIVQLAWGIMTSAVVALHALATMTSQQAVYPVLQAMT